MGLPYGKKHLCGRSLNGIMIRIKKIYSITAIVILCFVYLMIFGFSSQTGEESGGLSQKVSRKVIELADFFQKEPMSMEEAEIRASAIEFFVRKAAHFSEYALVGFLEFGLAICYIKRTGARIPLTVSVVFLSGFLDELHQYFVPGRWCSLTDVLIDTAGGCMGMLVFFFVYRIALSCKNRLGKRDG